MNFAYLNLKEHPRGNLILQSLLKNNLIPKIIIEENSPLAIKNRDGILSAFKNSSEKFPDTKSVIKNFDIPLIEVDNHNDPKCEKALKELDLDLVVLGDTRIIKDNVRNIPKIGIINSHPGYLPDVRGNNPYIWAIIHDLPQGCSVHFIDENVDTGDLIFREKIDLKNYKSYVELLKKINLICCELMVEAVKKISSGSYPRTPQKQIKFVKEHHIEQEFFAAPPEVKAEAIRRLESS